MPLLFLYSIFVRVRLDFQLILESGSFPSPKRRGMLAHKMAGNRAYMYKGGGNAIFPSSFGCDRSIKVPSKMLIQSVKG